MARIGKRLKNAYQGIDRDGFLPLEDALRLIKSKATAKFDETIEVAMNLGIDPRHADQMVRGMVTLPNGTGKTVRVAVFAEGENATKAEEAGEKADFRWPARGRVIAGFSGRGGNEGINIAVPEGTPVKAAESGTVAYAGSELKGYGNLVLIRHANGYVSAYAHNGELKVKRGDTVKRGQVVASSGQTGNVSSPQLHFELRKGSAPVDPTPYLNN